MKSPQLLPTFMLLVVVVIGGTAGYVAIEGWSIWDALYMTLTATSSDNLELSLEEIRIGQAALAGQPLSEAIQRDRINVVVVGIQHAHGRMEFNPAVNTVLRAGDHLIALGSSQTLKELERAAK